MLFPIKNREDLEKFDELASLENQVKALRLQDKSGKQNFHEYQKKNLNTSSNLFELSLKR